MQVKLGIRENLNQFILLVFVNAFVGGMVGLERTILPKIAEAEFHIAAKTAILSFIIVFGLAKGFTNYYTGVLANKIGKKNLLVIGWLFFSSRPIYFNVCKQLELDSYCKHITWDKSRLNLELNSYNED